MEMHEFVDYIGKKDAVEFSAMEDTWVKGTVVGIDLEDELVKVKTDTKAHWMKPYFQLNKNFPKVEKIRILSQKNH